MRAVVQTESSVHGVTGESLVYEVAGRLLLDHVDLHVERGSSVAVTGPSGSGKTTLLMCLAGMLPVSSGTVRIAGREVSRLNSRARAAVRLSHVGVVYQFGELLPELNPVENVALPLLLAGAPTRQSYLRARELLDQLGLASIAEAPTETLSGGERQRVAVARAVVAKPSLVLADEPTGALDSVAAQFVSELLFALPRQHGCALVVVTHNHLVADVADRQLHLADGKLTSVCG